MKYGYLTLLEPEGIVRKKHLCRCVCGIETLVTLASLRSGNTNSCGCLRAKTGHENFFKHGLTASPEYCAWQLMKDRCYNKNNPKYSYYGGRGIDVSNRWKNSFESFLVDMGKRPSALHTLERKNGEKGYSLDNCKWATRKEQARNRRNTKMVSFRGEIKPLAEWCELLGLEYDYIYKRLWRGSSVEQAFTTEKKE